MTIKCYDSVIASLPSCRRSNPSSFLTTIKFPSQDNKRNWIASHSLAMTIKCYDSVIASLPSCRRSNPSSFLTTIKFPSQDNKRNWIASHSLAMTDWGGLPRDGINSTLAMTGWVACNTILLYILRIYLKSIDIKNIYASI
jgi:hypothetical protein